MHVEKVEKGEMGIVIVIDEALRIVKKVVVFHFLLCWDLKNVALRILLSLQNQFSLFIDPKGLFGF